MRTYIASLNTLTNSLFLNWWWQPLRKDKFMTILFQLLCVVPCSFKYILPTGSMYGVFTYMCHKNQLNVGKYTIHGSYGSYIRVVCTRHIPWMRDSIPLMQLTGLISIHKKNNDLLHRNLTWNLKMMVSKRNFLSWGLLFRFYVKFWGCIRRNDNVDLSEIPNNHLGYVYIYISPCK